MAAACGGWAPGRERLGLERLRVGGDLRHREAAPADRPCQQRGARAQALAGAELARARQREGCQGGGELGVDQLADQQARLEHRLRHRHQQTYAFAEAGVEGGERGRLGKRGVELLARDRCRVELESAGEEVAAQAVEFEHMCRQQAEGRQAGEVRAEAGVAFDAGGA